MAFKNSLVLKTVGGLGVGLILGFHFRRKFSYLTWHLKTSGVLNAPPKVHIISDVEHWEKIAAEFCQNAHAISALGFDCEWVQFKKNRNPVALMQLATHTGICALFRLNIFQDVPFSLKEILANEQIIKVGVGSELDAQYLMEDYSLRVNGWVDLRHLVLKTISHPDSSKGGSQEKLGLQALAMKFLGKKLNKDWTVRGGNWEAPTLSNLQVQYAAEDTQVGILLLITLLDKLWTPPSFWPPINWESTTAEAVHKLCFPFREISFSNQPTGAAKSQGSRTQDGMRIPSQRPRKECRSSYSVRKSPLYHNSALQAPDGEMLCICDPQKAYWYVEKGLGKLISEDPLVVRLNFEPAGRPNKEGNDGQFYLQERFNMCVVCGKKESYIRKNIIPHEYRQYFPKILKSHQSHDVVLLCTKCHQRSNILDTTLRFTLAREFQAPIGCGIDVKVRVEHKLKAVRSAGGALSKSRDQIPPTRIAQLESVLKEFFETEELTDEHINMAAELNSVILNKDYVPHGYKVYLHYKTVGLINFEQRWRQWFLDSMQPEYLPEKWSTTHNHEKLRQKMSRYPLDSPIREDYKIALVGTEGSIDVPYVPQKNRKDPSSLFGLNEERENASAYEIVECDDGFREKEIAKHEKEIVEQRTEIFEGEEITEQAEEIVEQRTEIIEGEEITEQAEEIVEQRTEIFEGEEITKQAEEIVEQKTEIIEGEEITEQAEEIEQRTEILEGEEIVEQRTEIIEGEEITEQADEIVEQRTQIVEGEEITEQREEIVKQN